MEEKHRAPWTAHLDGEANFATLLDKEKHWLASIQINGEIHSHFQKGMFNLMAAAPQLYDAVEAADTLCAVLNISDLTPQARGCVREAWPLIQDAIAAIRPNSQYAAAIKDAHQHEIKRLDSLVTALTKALGYAIERADAWHDDSRGNGDCPELEDERALLQRTQHMVPQNDKLLVTVEMLAEDELSFDMEVTHEGLTVLQEVAERADGGAGPYKPSFSVKIKGAQA